MDFIFEYFMLCFRLLQAQNLLALVPVQNVDSDAIFSTSSDDEVKTPESLPAPSLDSSLERL